MIGLSDKQLKEKAPAIFATEPAEFVSENYTFVPTNRIIDEFRNLDFIPTDAQQVGYRNDKERMVGKHIVRLRHKDLVTPRDVGESIPEIVLVNGHGWQTSYKLLGAIFRMVCSNGMIVSDQEFGNLKQLHKGFDPEDIVTASKEFLSSTAKTFKKVETFQSIDMDKKDIMKFGREAARLRWDDAGDLFAERILQPRRQADMGDNLWLVMNRCQESLVRGGFENPHTERLVRPVTSITADLKLNEKLWDLTEQFAHRLN